MVEDVPSEGEFVELSFKGEFENQSPIQGRVLEVDSEPDIHATSLLIVVNDADGEREVVYSEGEVDGKSWSNVRVLNSDIALGENADYQVL